MKRDWLKSCRSSTAQSALLFGLMFSLASFAEADEVTQSLVNHFESEQDFRFINYERVEHSHADEYGNFSYLVMDFDAKLAWANLQDNIHHICSKVLSDRTLLRTLSDQGYDMISVSFDNQSQYDCL